MGIMVLYSINGVITSPEVTILKALTSCKRISLIFSVVFSSKIAACKAAPYKATASSGLINLINFS
jgi:hypothetical protein